MLKFSFIFAFVLSYIYLKNLTTLFFSIHLNRCLSLAKSLIQAKQLLSDSLRKNNDVLQKCLLLTPFRFHLVFKYSLVCCVHACAREGKVMLETPQVIKYHEILAEMTLHQAASYLPAPSENPESFL